MLEIIGLSEVLNDKACANRNFFTVTNETRGEDNGTKLPFNKWWVNICVYLLFWGRVEEGSKLWLKASITCWNDRKGRRTRGNGLDYDRRRRRESRDYLTIFFILTRIGKSYSLADFHMQACSFSRHFF